MMGENGNIRQDNFVVQPPFESDHSECFTVVSVEYSKYSVINYTFRTKFTDDKLSICVILQEDNLATLYHHHHHLFVHKTHTH